MDTFKCLHCDIKFKAKGEPKCPKCNRDNRFGYNCQRIENSEKKSPLGRVVTKVDWDKAKSCDVERDFIAQMPE